MFFEMRRSFAEISSVLDRAARHRVQSRVHDQHVDGISLTSAGSELLQGLLVTEGVL